MSYFIGIDIGSTTVKVVVLDEKYNILFKDYQRHMSRVREKADEMLRQVAGKLAGKQVRVAITGSAGLGVAKACGIDFVQEVFATAGAVDRFLPGTDAVIELGGEDAKIIFFTGGLEERMNGSCAGGTGAFIDQMATLLGVTPDELDELAARHEKIYSIASRCGVFAKSDIQPLLNQGARREDIAASIFQAVVEQTIAGLAQGRRITGRVAFLGGPLFFQKELRRRFVETLKLPPEDALFPENAAYFVAMGAALHAAKLTPCAFDTLLAKLEDARSRVTHTDSLPPLFESEEEYREFRERHASCEAGYTDPASYRGPAWLGVDAGSTTTKLVLIDAENKILWQYYASNKGNPVSVVKDQLGELYKACPGAVIRGAAVTGYGEDLIKNAFGVDYGLVETVAHFYAARHFRPDVDFILDIGGQDIKCFKIRNDAVDSIMLNEACSSGCGSFIETFALAMGYSVKDFAALGILARHPVQLGTRCTVFMNSSVKQAQKDGAGVDDISAGLSMSVVKNAIYKVIRASSPSELGKHIVVQGGTFYNDAVLRSFEREIGAEVTRPAIAGLMGAYGSALYAREQGESRGAALIGPEALAGFTHETKTANCGLCGNHCPLTINTFGGGRRYISGNRCDRPLGGKKQEPLPDLFKFKYERLRSYQPVPGPRGKIGVPMTLNMYENLPFWHTFLTNLGFEVVLSPASNRQLYIRGQYTIPSDTVCYPAKLVHGHIEALLDEGITTIFYPCLPYNFDEHRSDNHYNCPVVAYYPELIGANVTRLKDVRYLNPYFDLDRPAGFVKAAGEFFGREFGAGSREVKAAAKAAYAAYNAYTADVRREGERALEFAKANGRRVAVLAGRPYHVDPEINHGIDGLLTSYGLVVVSEDSVAHLGHLDTRHVLNQWTYHARLYAAADFVTTRPDTELIQLVSFGCGVDAITTDETREICERGGKLYTQIKIDEIANLGAVRIRIRSLIAAMESREGREKPEAERGA